MALAVAASMAPAAFLVQWLQCILHALNLALEKSVCFKKIGKEIRSVASFCHGGRHETLVNAMLWIQDPSLIPPSISASLRAKYVAAMRG